MLTDGDLKKLGSVTRSNPHKKDWSAMRLFLQSQVQRTAHLHWRQCTLRRTRLQTHTTNLHD